VRPKTVDRARADGSKMRSTGGPGARAVAFGMPRTGSRSAAPADNRDYPEDPYSVLLNSAIAMPSMTSPITATMVSDNQIGTSQPFQVIPGDR
jgi:hypothetical protein